MVLYRNNGICPKCKTNKKIFNQSYCKKCKSIYRKEYYLKYKEKEKQNNLRYYSQNKDNLLKKHKTWCKTEKGEESIKKSNKKYLNKPKTKLRIKLHSQKPRVKLQRWQYRQKNSSKLLRKNNYYKRFNQDPEFRIRIRLRSLLYISLKKYIKNGKVMKSKKYGINYEKIIEHLKPFPRDLSNLDIHHKKPLFYFKFIKPNGSPNLKEIKKAFAPENHQWLSSNINRSIQHRILLK